MSRSKIRIGSRGSKLALYQSGLVIEHLSRTHPNIEFEQIVISTTGDRNTQVSLGILGGEGVFVKELEDALLQNRIDLAVHSLKDMLTIIPDGLTLAAVPQRVDPRDVLISRSGGLKELPAGAKVGTGSERRAVQIHALRPDIEVCGLRGNIDTRLKKVSAQGLDCIIMAAAALIRLNMQDRITEYLPPDTFVPAVGQGALGLEARSDDKFLAEIVSPMNDLPTQQAVIAERQFLSDMGGGCRAPIAALGTVMGESILLRGIVANPGGSKIIRAETKGAGSHPEKVGNALAQEMLAQGAKTLIDAAGRNT